MMIQVHRHTQVSLCQCHCVTQNKTFRGKADHDSKARKPAHMMFKPTGGDDGNCSFKTTVCSPEDNTKPGVEELTAQKWQEGRKGKKIHCQVIWENRLSLSVVCGGNFFLSFFFKSTELPTWRWPWVGVLVWLCVDAGPCSNMPSRAVPRPLPRDASA